MSAYGDGIMMSNYLDPIAKVWGVDFPTISFAKAASAPKGPSKKSKRRLKKKLHS